MYSEKRGHLHTTFKFDIRITKTSRSLLHTPFECYANSINTGCHSTVIYVLAVIPLNV